MKKIFTTLLAASLMLLGTQAFAQISVNAGYLNSTVKVGNADPSKANGGFAGVSYNVPVAGGLCVAPGLYYSMITSKSTSSLGSTLSASGIFTEHAINVPLYMNYGIELANDTNVFVFGGPTAQFGLSSKRKYEASAGGASNVTRVDNYDNDNYNRFNVYLGGGIGFQISAIQITVGYDYGMINLYKGDNAPNAHRSNFKIGVGYAF